MGKAVIFDLDNTLYNYDSAHKKAFAAVTDYALARLELSPEVFAALHLQAQDRLRRRAGAETAAVHNRLLRYQMILEETGRPLLHALRMTETYWSAFLADLQPDGTTAACLRALKAAGYRLGVGTNMTADYQFAKLEKLALLDLLDFVVTSEEAGAEKPGARLFACCVEKAGCPPGNCAFVGDNLTLDVLGARRQGLRPVWLSLEPPPQGIASVPSLAELPGLLTEAFWQGAET